MIFRAYKNTRSAIAEGLFLCRGGQIVLPAWRDSRTGFVIIQYKKPVIRFAHFRALFSRMLLKTSFQRTGKTKPGTFVPGFLYCRGGQTRTDDPLVPNQMRYQLRHTPFYPPKLQRRRIF
jgi:hypothetical protein